MKFFTLFALLSTAVLITSCNSKGTTETSTETTTTTGKATGIAYPLDAPRCELKWMAFKPTGSHYGIVPITGGTVYVDGDIITGGSVEINMSGLQVQDAQGEMKAKLEGHLKGTVPGKEDDFFNVGKFPMATFDILGSTKLENDPLGTHMINGNLTIKGITKPISIKSVLDFSSGVALKATTEPFVIDRSQWDVKFKSKSFYDDLKDDFINDEVKIELTLGAVKPQ